MHATSVNGLLRCEGLVQTVSWGGSERSPIQNFTNLGSMLGIRAFALLHSPQAAVRPHAAVVL